jgi:hypothetical protein
VGVLEDSFIPFLLVSPCIETPAEGSVHHATPSRTPFFAPLETHDPIHFSQPAGRMPYTNHATYLTVPPASITSACFEYRGFWLMGAERQHMQHSIFWQSLCKFHHWIQHFTMHAKAHHYVQKSLILVVDP